MADGAPAVVRIGVTGASGRLGTLLVRELGGEAAPWPTPPGAAATGVTVAVLCPFTFDVADYSPWAGTAGAAAAGGDASPFADAVSAEGEAEAAAAAAAAASAAGRATARLVRAPVQLDLGDAAAVAGAFTGLDIVIHLAATIHADAPWATVSRNNIDATAHVAEECVRAGVRRLVFASSNHTQAADFFTSLDPAAEGGMCALRPEMLAQPPPLTTLRSPAAPDGYYALSKLLGEQLCQLCSSRHGLETVCL